MQDLLSAICEGNNGYDGDDVNAIRLLHQCNAVTNTVRSQVKSSDTWATIDDIRDITEILKKSLVRSKIIDTIKTKETEAETETPKLLQQVEAATHVARQLQRNELLLTEQRRLLMTSFYSRARTLSSSKLSS